jgi:hypothetical protein
MRIISDFKDYYDSGAVYGIDKTRVFVRSKVKMNASVIGMPNLRKMSMWFVRSDKWISREERPQRLSFVGFCGKIYPFLDTNYTYGGQRERLHEHQQFNINKIVDAFGGTVNPRNGYRKWTGNDKKYVAKRRADFLDKLNSLANAQWMTSAFIKINSPAFLLEEEEEDYVITANPILKDLGFYRMVDTVTAWQAVEQYVSNILVGDRMPEPKPITDVQRAETHGFDKWSFRKEPTDRK